MGQASPIKLFVGTKLREQFRVDRVFHVCIFLLESQHSQASNFRKRCACSIASVSLPLPKPVCLGVAVKRLTSSLFTGQRGIKNRETCACAFEDAPVGRAPLLSSAAAPRQPFWPVSPFWRQFRNHFYGTSRWPFAADVPWSPQRAVFTTSDAAPNARSDSTTTVARSKPVSSSADGNQPLRTGSRLRYDDLSTATSQYAAAIAAAAAAAAIPKMVSYNQTPKYLNLMHDRKEYRCSKICFDVKCF